MHHKGLGSITIMNYELQLMTILGFVTTMMEDQAA